MLTLDATTKTFEIVLAGAVAANQLPVTVNYTDITTTTCAGGCSDAATNSTTPVTIVAAPGASTQRHVETITVHNADTASVTFTISLNNNSTLRTMFKIVLGALENFLYERGKGWGVFDSNGGLVTGVNVSDTAYAVTWDGVTAIAPSKNAVYDKLHFLDLYSLRLIQNLKLAVNASVNKLDIFTRSGGAAPDASNIISVAIPDGNGSVFRTRAATYLSGTSQFIMADAANYWSKGSLDGEIKTAYVYAIWDANGGIVWALGGYSGFTRVPVVRGDFVGSTAISASGITFTAAGIGTGLVIGDRVIVSGATDPLSNGVKNVTAQASGAINLAPGGGGDETSTLTISSRVSDDFFLLEASSTYTPVATDYCVCVGKIRYEYDTGDAPDHTIQATVLDAPQIMWNPKSDYGRQENLATTVTSESEITEASRVSLVVKQSGYYDCFGAAQGQGEDTLVQIKGMIKVGSATYANAVYKAGVQQFVLGTNVTMNVALSAIGVYLNAGDTVHLGVYVDAGGSTRQIWGDSEGAPYLGCTHIAFRKTD